MIQKDSVEEYELLAKQGGEYLGEGQVPHLALTWELYSVAPAQLEERVNGVLCETVAATS